MTFTTRVVLLSLSILLLATGNCFAGGPLYVGGPSYGVDGVAMIWDPTAMPIQYRVDPGPMSKTQSGTVVINNASGLQQVNSMFGVWSSVPTAAVSFSNAGSLLQTGTYTGGTVNTTQQYNDLMSSCSKAEQNPVVFDPDGSLMKALGMDDSIIGFAGACSLNLSKGYIRSAKVVMNGKWLDGRYVVSIDEYAEAITHEIGHLLGMDHSQINYFGDGVCYDLDALAGRPLMYPYLDCAESRKSKGLSTLSMDDIAWISRLYPGSTFATSYGTISGYIYFPDGVTYAQGVNVIARQIDDVGTSQNESRRNAVSAVSGYRFTGNPGQSITAKYLPCSTTNSACPTGFLDDNTKGDRMGSRDPMLIGYYEIPVPPGTYTVEIEQINPAFVGGSSVGPMIVQPGDITPKFYNSAETPYDDVNLKSTINVSAGQALTNINIRMNGNLTRFDSYESGADLVQPKQLEVFTSAKARCA